MPVVRMTLWRDADEAARRLPGMMLGVRALPLEPVAAVGSWYADGVRFVEVECVIDLEDGDPATLRALLLVRELTAAGVVTCWRLRSRTPNAARQMLGHLYPPVALLPGGSGAAAELARWRAAYQFCLCVHRKGPGFVQVRDRRRGVLARVTVTRPEHLRAIDVLGAGAPRDAVPARVLSDFRGAALVGDVGDRAWWLPYRVRRWPVTSAVV
jgi:Family of unknown function (DUF5825)